MKATSIKYLYCEEHSQMCPEELFIIGCVAIQKLACPDGTMQLPVWQIDTTHHMNVSAWGMAMRLTPFDLLGLLVFWLNGKHSQEAPLL